MEHQPPIYMPVNNQAHIDKYALYIITLYTLVEAPWFPHRLTQISLTFPVFFVLFLIKYS